MRGRGRQPPAMAPPPTACRTNAQTGLRVLCHGTAARSPGDATAQRAGIGRRASQQGQAGHYGLVVKFLPPSFHNRVRCSFFHACSRQEAWCLTNACCSTEGSPPKGLEAAATAAATAACCQPGRDSLGARLAIQLLQQPLGDLQARLTVAALSKASEGAGWARAASAWCSPARR